MDNYIALHYYYSDHIFVSSWEQKFENIMSGTFGIIRQENLIAN